MTIGILGQLCLGVMEGGLDDQPSLANIIRSAILLELCVELPPGLLLVQDGELVNCREGFLGVVGHGGLLLYERVGEREWDLTLEISVIIGDISHYGSTMFPVTLLHKK